MFSRSASTITPSRISHSTTRSDWLTILNVARPAGTERVSGSQVLPAMVTVCASPATPRDRDILLA